MAVLHIASGIMKSVFMKIMVKGCCIKFLLTFYIKNIISVILSLCDSAVLY